MIYFKDVINYLCDTLGNYVKLETPSVQRENASSYVVAVVLRGFVQPRTEDTESVLQLGTFKLE